MIPFLLRVRGVGGGLEIIILSKTGERLPPVNPNRIEPPPGLAHRALWSVWADLQPGAAVPPKAAFDPVELVRVLPQIFLCEWEDPSEPTSLKFRVHGSSVAQILHRDLTGKYLFDILPADRARRVAEAIILCMEASMPVRQRFFSAFPGRESVLVDRMVLPLADPEGRCRFAIGSLSRCDVGEPDSLTVRESAGPATA